jgi:hypothetical protein
MRVIPHRFLLGFCFSSAGRNVIRLLRRLIGIVCVSTGNRILLGCFPIPPYTHDAITTNIAIAPACLAYCRLENPTLCLDSRRRSYISSHGQNQIIKALSFLVGVFFLLYGRVCWCCCFSPPYMVVDKHWNAYGCSTALYIRQAKINRIILEAKHQYGTTSCYCRSWVFCQQIWQA